MWKHPDRLEAEIAEFLDAWPQSEQVAVTMTGELADCYATKREGVARITEAVMRAAGPQRVRVWTTDGRFLAPYDVDAHWEQVAAANWHALATCVARRTLNTTGLLIDIGSTTTDLIPFAHGEPTATGRTDLTRMLAGELLYTGVRRTPLCQIARVVPMGGRLVPVAAEWFATSLDLYLWRGDLPEDSADHDTADGRPATRAAAHTRLAHMLCGDHVEIPESTIDTLVEFWAAAQAEQITTALRQVLSAQTAPLESLVLSGSGTFLAERVIDRLPELASLPRTTLARVFGADIATAACAWAVARLLAESAG